MNEIRKGSVDSSQEKASAKDNDTHGLLINEAIRARQVQLIAEDGNNVGTVSRDDALSRAQRVGLDLVMLSEKGGSGVPVVKIMDHGKELYNRKKKQAEAKKSQKVIQVKEVKIRPKIAGHDYITKMKQAIIFLKEGKRVKFTLVFKKGREMITKDERGNELFAKIEETLAQEGFFDNLAQDKETKMGTNWSKVYYLKKV